MTKAQLKNKFILDACCGGRMMWIQKNHPNALYIDKRIEPKGFFKPRPRFSVTPDEAGDFTKLNYPKASFHLVVFDPPHVLRRSGIKDSRLSQKYGKLFLDSWEETIAKGLAECWRVLKPKGVLVFKWCEESKKIEDLERFFPATPLFGSRVGKNNKTLWLVFMKL